MREIGVVYNDKGEEIHRHKIEKSNVIPFDTTTQVRVDELQQDIHFKRTCCTDSDFIYEQLMKASEELEAIFIKHNIVQAV